MGHAGAQQKKCAERSDMQVSHGQLGAGHEMEVSMATPEQDTYTAQARTPEQGKQMCLRHFINIKGKWRLRLVPPGTGDILAKA